MRALALLAALLPLPAFALSFEVPVDCEMGKDCFVQNYVDQNPSKKGYADYTCGPLSYPAHDGTDFRVRDYVLMEKGVRVLAAAPGKVKGVRDGMADISYRTLPPNALTGRECGNGVIIEHEGGYASQYCHMKRGSIRVAAGTEVKAGDVLGKVGLSGMTEFPHMHFELTKDKRQVDPFIGEAVIGNCKEARTPLWSEAAAERLKYIPTGMLGSGTSDSVPEASRARHGFHQQDEISAMAPVLTYWVDIFGARKGDHAQLRIESPNGNELVKYEYTFDRPKAQWFQMVGKKRREEPWATGTYKASFTLKRDGKPVLADTRKFNVK